MDPIVPVKIVEGNKFQCIFTGKIIEKAYLISGSIGSFLDPIIAATWVQNNRFSVFSADAYEKLLKWIAEDTGDPTNPYLTDLIDNSFDIISREKFNAIIEQHLIYQKGNYNHLLRSVGEVQKKETPSKKKQQSTSQQQQKKPIYTYFISKEGEYKQDSFLTGEMLELETPILVKRLSFVLIKPNVSQLILSSGDQNEEVSPQMNSLFAKNPDLELRGDCMIISTKKIFPDGNYPSIIPNSNEKK